MYDMSVVIIFAKVHFLQKIKDSNDSKIQSI